ncbi:MAG: hypothetical protein N2484_06935 [Clostridia bacterium]|nr:hypothetical protein [Clostridia bacterium]
MNISFNSAYSWYSPSSFPTNSPSNSSNLTNNNVSKSQEYNDPQIRADKRAGRVECETCKSRKYQDGSDDPGVSFKAPGHIDPSVSGAVVMSHEQEHVRNEQSKAASENRKVVSQSVKLETSVCPECGRAYVSGGQTTTVTKGNSEEKKDYFVDQYNKAMAGHFGKIVDVRL